MKKTTIKIDGMMCGMCESHINQAIRHAFTVRKVTSSQKQNRTVVLSDAGLDQDALRQAIESPGYDVGTISEEEIQKRGWLLS